MKKSLLRGFAVTLFLLLLWGVESSFVMLGYCSASYTVRVTSPERSFRKLMCAIVDDQVTADHCLKSFMSGSLWRSDQPPELNDPWDGRPVVVSVNYDSATTLSGREINWRWQKLLVVVGESPEGKRIGRIIEVPDPKVTKQVYMTLP